MFERPRKVLLTGLVALLGLFLARPGIIYGADTAAEGGLQPLSLEQVGLHRLRNAEPYLTGSGTRIAAVCRSLTYLEAEPQNDYRPYVNHNCFQTNKLAFYDDGQALAGLSAHSTAVCSILFGRDNEGFNSDFGRFRYEGTAPDAEAQVYEFWYFLIHNVFPGLAPEADIITASIGDQFESWWTRGIESMVEQFGVTVVASIGNGLTARDPVLYPGAGANVLGVGVVNTVNSDNVTKRLANLGLAYPQHSSFGPSDDGRCKPDIVAPGNCLAAADTEPNVYQPTGNWSSFATPVVAGCVSLLVQRAREDANLAAAVSPYGGNCVIKAVLMNSATKLPYWHKGRVEPADDHQSPLDYIQGAGMLNAEAAHEQLVAGMAAGSEVAATGWDLNDIDGRQKTSRSYRFNIAVPAGKLITVTAAWNKHYDSFYPFEARPEKDCDLRVELWALDANNPENDYLLDYSDSSVDNVEHIYHAADANRSGYEIVVLCNNADDAEARYGLAWSVREEPDNSDNLLWYDLNADGVVDNLDVTIFLDNWLAALEQSDRYLMGDINADGQIDAADLMLLMKNIDRQADWRKQ
jgi:hypothetical protein